MVPELFDVVTVLANPRSQGRDQGDDLVAREHLVDTSFFDIEDLAAKRQDRLYSTIATLLGRPPCAVTLDDEKFGLLGVPFLTVGELSGE